MTEEKMLQGKLYDTSDEKLSARRLLAHRLCRDYNLTCEEEEEKRRKILSELLPNIGKGTYLQGPIQFDYGIYITMGMNCYANFNLTILDCCAVTIGNHVLFGPNCTVATPVHPFLKEERRLRIKPDGTWYDLEYARPVIIEDDCWLASNVMVCGGVTIGAGSIIGAGSVVTRDIPPNSLAVGAPCRVIRTITEQDSLRYRPDICEDPTLLTL